MLTDKERVEIAEVFDIYDLVEMLDLTIEEFIDVFDYLIVDCNEIMNKVT